MEKREEEEDGREGGGKSMRPGRASGVDAAGAGTADAGAGLLLLVLVGEEREGEGTRVVGGGSRSTVTSWGGRAAAGELQRETVW